MRARQIRLAWRVKKIPVVLIEPPPRDSVCWAERKKEYEDGEMVIAMQVIKKSPCQVCINRSEERLNTGKSASVGAYVLLNSGRIKGARRQPWVLVRTSPQRATIFKITQKGHRLGH